MITELGPNLFQFHLEKEETKKKDTSRGSMANGQPCINHLGMVGRL